MSININILPQGTLAIYEQIIMQLKNAIVTGELKSGEALPSIRALAADLQVSVITTKRAYEELEKEGLIRSVAGKGFYVCEYNTDYLKEKQLMMIEKRTQEIIYEAKNAGLSCDDLVDMIRTLTHQVGAVGGFDAGECGGGAGRLPRHPRAGRIWSARLGGQDDCHPVRP